MENIELYQVDTSKNQKKIKSNIDRIDYSLEQISGHLDNINMFLDCIEKEQDKINQLENDLPEFTHQCQLTKQFNSISYTGGSKMYFNMNENNEFHGQFQIMNRIDPSLIRIQGEYNNGKLHNKLIIYSRQNDNIIYIIKNYNMGILCGECIKYDPTYNYKKIEEHKIYKNGTVIRDIIAEKRLEEEKRKEQERLEEEKKKIKVILPKELQ